MIISEHRVSRPKVVETVEIKRAKVRLGVPPELASCHTAEIGGYVLEGHVPADAIKRLLSEKPGAKGLAVPGMPVGSPRMEAEGSAPETYDVVLFGNGKPRFSRVTVDVTQSEKLMLVVAGM